MAVLDSIGGFLFGESPADQQKKLLDNEFRDVGGSDFSTPGLNEFAARLRNQTTPQAGRSGFAGDQRGLVRQLQAQAAGRGPGQELARRQAAQQAQAGIQQQLGQAASGRQGASPLAARLAAQNSSAISGQAANAATQGGLQAQLQATSQLGNVLQGARGLDQSNAQFNANARLQQQAQALQALGLSQADIQAFQQARTNRFNTIGGVATNPAATSATQVLGAATGVLEGLGLGK